MKRSILVLALTLCLAVPACAGPAAELSAQAARLETAAQVTGDGLAAFVPHDSRTASALHLTAEHATVQVREKSGSNVAGLASTTYREGAQESHHEDLSLRVVGQGPLPYWFVMGDGVAMQATGDAILLQPAADEYVARDHIGTTRTSPGGPAPHDPWVAHGGSVEGSLASAGTVTWRGDFRLTLWSMSARGTDADGPVAFWSGEERSPGPAQGLDEIVRRQAWITITNGTLRAEVHEPGAFFVLDQASGAAEGAAHVYDAAGTLHAPSGARSVSGDVRLAGPVSLDVTSSSDRLAMTVLEATSARTGGETVPLTAVAGSERAWWWPTLGVLALPLVAAAMHGLHVRRTMSLMEAALGEGAYERAAKAANRLVHHRRHGARAAFTEALARIRLGDAAGAQEALLLVPRDEAWGASRDYLLAHALALRGETVAARRALVDCLRRDPSMAREVHHDAVLKALVHGGEGAYS